MKQRRAFFLMALVSLCLFCLTAAWCAALLMGSAAPAEQTLAAAQVNESAGSAWLLCLTDGQVCVRLPDGASVPTGVNAALLPRSDREALQQGIPVHSREALTALLEDLGA